MTNVTSLDTRIAYGAQCTWWDDIRKVGNRNGLPCCPHCGGMLYEMVSIDHWLDSVDKHEAKGNPGYRAMVQWSRGKCFRSYGDLKKTYLAEKPIP